MKRIIICLLLALLLTSVSAAAYAQEEFSTTAQSAMVMEQSSHRELFAKNADKRLPMASTTKIVTALVTLNNANLDDVVEIPAKACGIEGSSVYLRAGEHLTVRELLYGLMLRSGNDCATALALHVSGSMEAFAELMNDTARKLGCENSNFVNSHGLHDDNHYTSARDLALITCEAFNNSDFCQIVNTKSVRISNEGYDYDRVLVNKNKLLTRYEFADGVKTGYTKKAGRCFVGSATQNGMKVVVVVLNCGPMFEETEAMLKTAFANYLLVTVVPKNKVCGSVKVGRDRKYYVCENGFRYPVTKQEELNCEILLTSDNPHIDVYLNKTVIATLPLKTVNR